MQNSSHNTRILPHIRPLMTCSLAGLFLCQPHTSPQSFFPPIQPFSHHSRLNGNEKKRCHSSLASNKTPNTTGSMNMKTALTALLSAILFILLSVSAFAETTAFDDAYDAAFSGDVKKALEIVDSFADSDLTTEQLAAKKLFHSRFGAEVAVFSGESELVNTIMNFYQAYWKKLLLKITPADQALNELAMNIISYIYANHLKDTGVTIEELQNLENLGKHLTELLLKDGYHAKLGQTGQAMDIMLWKQEERQHYSVDLPETKTDIQVVFLKDMVTLGWIGYSTLDKYNVGGWAVGTDIFCPGDQYDRSSAHFRVNLLAHEAQHCADYQSYPKLTQTDLEYRAKLAELSAADETVYDVIGRLMDGQSDNRESAHSFASYCLVRELSRNIFDSDRIEDMAKWKTIPAE